MRSQYSRADLAVRLQTDSGERRCCSASPVDCERVFLMVLCFCARVLLVFAGLHEHSDSVFIFGGSAGNQSQF